MSESSLDLSRYRCSRCDKTPTEEKEIFHGCLCGNRFFRFIGSTSNSDESNEEPHEAQLFNEGISDIEIVRPGVFRISVEGLLGKKKSALILSANEPGKYSIKF